MQYYTSATIITHVNIKQVGKDDEIYEKMPVDGLTEIIEKNYLVFYGIFHHKMPVLGD